MKQYEYKSYEEYKAIQEEANRRKINNVWVSSHTVDKIAKEYGPSAKNIICHGTRNAAEQKLFENHYPDAYIIGTEISSTACQFPMTIEWDFSEVNEKWVHKFDIVYSNSFDHSYDPVKTIQTWKGQLSKNGKLFLEHCYHPDDNISRPSDPLEIQTEELIYLLRDQGLSISGTFDSYGFSRNRVTRIYICEEL